MALGVVSLLAVAAALDYTIMHRRAAQGATRYFPDAPQSVELVEWAPISSIWMLSDPEGTGDDAYLVVRWQKGGMSLSILRTGSF